MSDCCDLCVKTELAVLDGGVDSHVGGKSWLALTPISGPLVKFANCMGFDLEHVHENSLPMISAVSEATMTSRRQHSCS